MQDLIHTWARGFELQSRSVRHSRLLRRAEVLWDVARPFYSRILTLIGRQGLQRNINGTDILRIHPACRAVQETYEPEVWDYLLSFLRPDDCVVDVGAHIGLYAAAMAKRLGPRGKVYAIEPDAANRALLIEHIRLNRLAARLICLPVAVSSSDGLIGFTANSNSESHIAVNDHCATSEVVANRLDTLFRSTRVDILKIDVEGFEEHVLCGATDLLSDLKRRPRLICMEVHPYAWEAAGTTADTLLNLLWALRYRTCAISGEPVSSIHGYGHVFAYPL